MIDWQKLIRALLGKPEPDREDLKPYGTISSEQMAIIIANKLDEIGSPADIYLPDKQCKVYRKQDVMSYSGLTEIASLKYIPETHDCDDFAAKAYGLFAGLVWTNNHAMNFIIDETGTFYFIEPQNKSLSQKLEGAQGTAIRFIIGR
jgi:hypothetical protein